MTQEEKDLLVKYHGRVGKKPDAYNKLVKKVLKDNRWCNSCKSGKEKLHDLVKKLQSQTPLPKDSKYVLNHNRSIEIQIEGFAYHYSGGTDKNGKPHSYGEAFEEHADLWIKKMERIYKDDPETLKNVLDGKFAKRP